MKKIHRNLILLIVPTIYYIYILKYEIMGPIRTRLEGPFIFIKIKKKINKI